MIETFPYLYEATRALDDQGYRVKTLAQLALTDESRYNYTVHPDGSQSQYLFFGDPSAEHIAFTSTPYGVSLEDPSFQVRLHTEQKGMGPDYCIVGVQVDGSTAQKFSPKQRLAISRGSFWPLAARYADVITDVAPTDDQRVTLRSFSKGSDVDIETVYQALSNASFELPAVERLGVFDYARSVERSRVGMLYAFMTSGDNLFRNVAESQSPALLEARGISEPEHPKAKSRHMKEIQVEGIRKIRRDILGNWALLGGFSTARSTDQLHAILAHQDAPRVVIGKMRDSEVLPAVALEDFVERNAEVIIYPDDHAAADNLYKNLAFAMATAAA